MMIFPVNTKKMLGICLAKNSVQLFQNKIGILANLKVIPSTVVSEAVCCKTRTS